MRRITFELRAPLVEIEGFTFSVFFYFIIYRVWRGKTKTWQWQKGCHLVPSNFSINKCMFSFAYLHVIEVHSYCRLGLEKETIQFLIVQSGTILRGRFFHQLFDGDVIIYSSGILRCISIRVFKLKSWRRRAPEDLRKDGWKKGITLKRVHSDGSKSTAWADSTFFQTPIHQGSRRKHAILWGLAQPRCTRAWRDTGSASGWTSSIASEAIQLHHSVITRSNFSCVSILSPLILLVRLTLLCFRKSTRISLHSLLSESASLQFLWVAKYSPILLVSLLVSIILLFTNTVICILTFIYLWYFIYLLASLFYRYRYFLVFLFVNVFIHRYC